jgi:predicted ATP-dependent endonuclease of OLD family
MQLIHSVQISKFRSFDSGKLDGLSENVVLVGPNNSGKSNVLRALNLFFNDEVEPRVFLSVFRDYHIPSRLSKKKREISVSVEFDLPKAFRFRKKLEEVEKFLGRRFWLRKTWSLESFEPALFHSKDGVKYDALDSHGETIAGQFLGLISFRYIPNRVDHTSIIREESPALQKNLARRFANYSKQKVDPLLLDLRKFAKSMVDPHHI